MSVTTGDMKVEKKTKCACVNKLQLNDASFLRNYTESIKSQTCRTWDTCRKKEKRKLKNQVTVTEHVFDIEMR